MAALDPVVILTGPPGAGKTATARALAERRTKAVHLESDRFFRFVASGYIEPWERAAHEQNSVVMDVVARAAAGYAEAGYFTIVDGIVDPRWFLQPLSRRLEESGNRVACFVLRPSLAVCIDRAAGRGSRPLADAAVVEQLWNAFAELGDLEANVIETDACSAEQAADLLAGRLDAGTLPA